MRNNLPINEKGFNPFCDTIGVVFDVYEDGFSRCRLEVMPSLLNPNGVVHGGVHYSMADTGMGAALFASLEPNFFCATVEIKIAYFKAVSEGELVCETTILHKGKKIAALESVIKNGGQLVSKATGTYSILQSK